MVCWVNFLYLTINNLLRSHPSNHYDELTDMAGYANRLNFAGINNNLIPNSIGVRAAQVVPHVHFHIIPRPANVPQLKNKSWTMFGRGQREELDDDEGEKLAGELRDELRKELEKYAGQGSKI